MNSKAPTNDKLALSALTAIGITLTFAFGLAWFQPSAVAHNFRSFWHPLDFVLFALLTYVVWYPICTELLLWLIAKEIPEPKQSLPPRNLRVAFITTFVPGSEPVELLRRILPALRKVDYQHDTWLLDEGKDDVARAICHQYGVHYFTRKGLERYNTDSGTFAARTKGGNHNAWYDAFGHRYDIVAQIDTDFIPRKDFLTKTLGYFCDPSVAFVGTPQIYGNTNRSFVARGAAEQQYTFYGPILRGLSGRNMMMLLGANHVIRVAALKDINYYGGHLTEDLLTGMTLHSQGWTSVYVPEALAIGEGPETWLAYFNQQMRWAFGCIDILFKHSASKLRTMNWPQRRMYLMLMQHYFCGTALVLGVGLLFIYSAFGIHTSSLGLGLLTTYIPLLVWQFIISLWLQKFNARNTERGLMFAGKVVSIAAMPIYFLALVGFVRGKRLAFKVTPKGTGQRSTTSLSLFTPHLTVGLVALTALLLTIRTHNYNPIIIIWAFITSALMFGVPIGAWLVSLGLSRQNNQTKATSKIATRKEAF